MKYKFNVNVALNFTALSELCLCLCLSRIQNVGVISGLTPLPDRDIRSSGMLSSVDWKLVTDVLGKPDGCFFKVILLVLLDP